MPLYLRKSYAFPRRLFFIAACRRGGGAATLKGEDGKAELFRK